MSGTGGMGQAGVAKRGPDGWRFLTAPDNPSPQAEDLGSVTQGSPESGSPNP